MVTAKQVSELYEKLRELEVLEEKVVALVKEKVEDIFENSLKPIRDALEMPVADGDLPNREHLLCEALAGDLDDIRQVLERNLENLGDMLTSALQPIWHTRQYLALLEGWIKDLRIEAATQAPTTESSLTGATPSSSGCVE